MTGITVSFIASVIYLRLWSRKQGVKVRLKLLLLDIANETFIDDDTLRDEDGYSAVQGTAISVRNQNSQVCLLANCVAIYSLEL